MYKVEREKNNIVCQGKDSQHQDKLTLSEVRVEMFL
jgi:hypothetical protein